jgi:hypothetical protein
MSQVSLTTVLKVVNDLAYYTAATVRGDRRIKVNAAMSAVGACEGAGNSPFEGLGTLLAKRRNNTRGLCFALLAEIFASSSLTAAERACRRIQKRRGRFQ